MKNGVCDTYGCKKKWVDIIMKSSQSAIKVVTQGRDNAMIIF